MNRRAALQMSVQSIVVFVLAFIVMGLLIGVIHTIFGQISNQTALIQQPGVDLGAQPSQNEPFIVQNGEVTINKGKDTKVYFGFYNTGDNLPLGATVKLILNKTGLTQNGVTNPPPIGCQGFGGSPWSPDIQANQAVLKTALPNGAITKYQTIMRLPTNPTVLSTIDRSSQYTCTAAVLAPAIDSNTGLPTSAYHIVAYGSFILKVL